MATVVLVRHGRSTANTAGVLAGRTAGTLLDDEGKAQARRAADRLAPVPLARVVTSPLERCRQTADALLAEQSSPTPLMTEDGIIECDYGAWQGRLITELAEDPLWSVVQQTPSAAQFPGGESMTQMATRAAEAIRRHDAEVEAEHGADTVWAAVSHGDLIKAILSDALGQDLDLFQRLHVDPASISIIRYTPDRPYVLGSNTHAGDLGWLRRSPDTVPGGGAGPASSDRS